mmetsp:Transcript_75222/g.110250  ORF Transcript_75222/g.110250 Transcript_75222/m.110250 type:complete len:246 (-) Transcript_75222:673-1410(-)
MQVVSDVAAASRLCLPTAHFLQSNAVLVPLYEPCSQGAHKKPNVTNQPGLQAMRTIGARLPSHSNAPPPPKFAALPAKLFRFRFTFDSLTSSPPPPNPAALLSLNDELCRDNTDSSVTATAPPASAAELCEKLHPSIIACESMIDKAPPTSAELLVKLVFSSKASAARTIVTAPPLPEIAKLLLKVQFRIRTTDLTEGNSIERNSDDHRTPPDFADLQSMKTEFENSPTAPKSPTAPPLPSLNDL